jgi:hypothetical protein
MAEKIHYENLPRCPLPVIFLDTYIISNIAKWKMGKELDQVNMHRAKNLFECLYQLVKAKKIICPKIQISQDEYRLDSRINEACEKVVVALSQGISFKGSQGVKDSQIQLAMKAYVEKDSPVDYSKEWLLMYQRDPIKQLLDNKPFRVRFNSVKTFESNEQIRERKENLKDELEEIKKADSNRTPSFEEKLEEEYIGYIRGIRRLGLEPLTKYLWERLGGKPEGVKGLIKFYHSEYLRSVPRVEITAKLWAGLAVYLKNAKPKQSDSNDIKMISTVLPYANLVVLDSTMTYLVRDKLHLHEKYNAKIYKLSEFDQPLAELQNIENKESPLKEFL